MPVTRPFILAASASLAAIFATVTIAEAQTRQKRGEPARTLTVKQRSFLDSGKVVRVGSESGYAQAGTYLNRSPVYFSQRSRYGAETLPGRFDLPGAHPLFNF